MSLISKYLYYFIKKRSEKEHRRYYLKKNAFYIEKYNLCSEKKTRKIIKKEMHELQKFWKVFPIQYFRYNMYRNDCKLTLSEMKDYIPDFFAYYLFYPQSFLERNTICEDKLLFHSICKGLKISQPKTIIANKDGRFFDENQNFISIEEAYKKIQLTNAAKLFCKPRFGVGGGGIHIFNLSDNQFTDKDKHAILNIEYLKNISSQDYLFQEGLVQHPIMNQIYPMSINTFRIVTEYSKNSGIKLLLTLLRMGCDGKEIDNASSGGIYLKIDENTGILSQYAFSGQQEKYESHPFTGFKFHNYAIPFWEEIVQFTKGIALKFSEIKYIGWDIAYTIDGPVVIEANNGPSVEILQDCYGGIRKVFKINSPTKFWYSENYSLKNLHSQL